MTSFISFLILAVKIGIVWTECTDIYGRSITPGIHFIPGPDICQLCVCDNTTPKWCKRVLCSPPQNCKSFVMGSSCCDYSCLDNTIPSGELRDEIDRRFLITIATAFLILTVLLFIIHKLRHRTIHVDRIQSRQVTEDRRSIGSIGFITGSIGYLNLSNGHHFDDHPLVHFPVYKPHCSYFPRGEAPPPYEEAMADTALNIPATTQMLTNEREPPDASQQRRRSNSAGVVHNGNASRSGSIVERCICEPQQPAKEAHSAVNSSAVATTAVPTATVATGQHRTIPLAVCVTSESANHNLDGVSHPINRRICAVCPIHNKMGADVDGVRGRANSTSQTEASTSGGARLVCPQSQFHFEANQIGVCSAQHRTLPLSASLSSPLPSTSEGYDRHQRFATFSSAINISSSFESEDQASTMSLEEAKKSQQKNLPSVSVTNETVTTATTNITTTTTTTTTTATTPSCHKNKNKHLKKERSSSSGSAGGCSAGAAVASAETASKDTSKCEQAGTTQLVDDYHAECENCNLNVNTECDGNEDYFSEQETMTLQRKLHENSSGKNNESAMKVSLTLPTNSRTRRCSVKNRKCGGGRWATKESSSVKPKLEYVSADEEESCLDEKNHSAGANKNNEENI